MPYRINGIGTTYIGARDFATDGTFLTTEWFTFVFVPVLPIRSHRVRPAGGNSYYLLKTTRPHLVQVLSTYGFILLLALEVAPIAFISSRMETTQAEEREIMMLAANFSLILIAFATFFLPWALRRMARRTASKP